MVGRSIAAISVAFTLAGCGGGNAAGDGADAAPPISYNCAADTRWKPFAPNTVFPGEDGQLAFTWVQANPSPPARYSNAWTVRVNTMTGGSGSDQGSGSDAVVLGPTVDSAEIIVTPFMPDHGHGSSIKATVTSMGSGMYSIDPVYLFMPGYWTITFTASSASGSDDVVFTACIPE